MIDLGIRIDGALAVLPHGVMIRPPALGGVKWAAAASIRPAHDPTTAWHDRRQQRMYQTAQARCPEIEDNQATAAEAPQALSRKGRDQVTTPDR